MMLGAFSSEHYNDGVNKNISSERDFRVGRGEVIFSSVLC